MRSIFPRQPWHQAWVTLAVYAALSSVDYVLTTTALSAGRMGLSPSGPHEANPLAVWLFTHEGAGSVLLYKGLAVAIGVLLLVVVRPMWPSPWARRVTLGLLGAGIAWEVLGVVSAAAVLAGV